MADKSESCGPANEEDGTGSGRRTSHDRRHVGLRVGREIEHPTKLRPQKDRLAANKRQTSARMQNRPHRKRRQRPQAARWTSK